jgi:hypothetical protein
MLFYARTVHIEAYMVENCKRSCVDTSVFLKYEYKEALYVCISDLSNRKCRLLGNMYSYRAPYIDCAKYFYTAVFRTVETVETIEKFRLSL